MQDTLEIGMHFQRSTFGEYKATVTNDGGVIIETVFAGSKQRHTVSVSQEQWDRLVAWVEWRQKDRAI